MEAGADKKFFNLTKRAIDSATPDSPVGKLISAMDEYVFPPYMDFITSQAL